VYTTEVVGNIRQSYPIEWIVTGLAIASAAGVYLLKPAIKLSSNYNMHFKQRTMGLRQPWFNIWTSLKTLTSCQAELVEADLKSTLQ
jgi:hypothetical protein